MEGYALEVKLVRWTCGCKEHGPGGCQDKKPHKVETLREAYVGSFGDNVKTKSDALGKWDLAIRSSFAPPHHKTTG